MCAWSKTNLSCKSFLVSFFYSALFIRTSSRLCIPWGWWNWHCIKYSQRLILFAFPSDSALRQVKINEIKGRGHTERLKAARSQLNQGVNWHDACRRHFPAHLFNVWVNLSPSKKAGSTERLTSSCHSLKLICDPPPSLTWKLRRGLRKDIAHLLLI